MKDKKKSSAGSMKVEDLAKILEAYKLDSIEVSGIKLTKSKHVMSEADLKKAFPTIYKPGDAVKLTDPYNDPLLFPETKQK